MRRFSLSSLRIRLLLLVLLAIIPALGLIIYSAAEQRRLGTKEIQQRALGLVRLAARDQGEFLAETRQLLRVLVQLPAVQNGDGPACSALFAGLLQQYPRYANLGAISRDGDLLCSALPTRGPINLSDRAYFQRALATRDFSVGDYQIGRATGKASVNFGYPVLDATGHVRAVVFAALDLAWLGQLAAEAQLPSGSTLTVVDRHGTVLARYPDPGGWVGRSVPNASIVKAALSQQARATVAPHGENRTVEAGGLDGVPRLFAFAALGGSVQKGDVHVIIGIPKRVAYAGADRLLRRNLATLGLVMALALTAAWVGGDLFLVRHVNALVNATRRVAAGDVSARTQAPYGSGELGQLARAFDEMAFALETRQAERDRAERQILQLNQELERRVKERTAELQATNAELEAFTYSVSHDLRAPLRHIDGFTRILVEEVGPGLNETARHYLERVREGARQMGALVDDLLHLSRVGRQQLNTHMTSLNSLVDEVVRDMKSETEGREIEWQIGKLPMLECDSGLMKQVFANLVSNAVKFTRTRSRAVIQIDQTRVNGEVTIFVRDNGIGFDMKYADKLFGLFQRLHRQEDFEGTGVGLATVQRIIYKHSGRVWAEAELDKGATFYFTLGTPAKDEPENYTTGGGEA